MEQSQEKNNYFVEVHAKILGLFLMKCPINASDMLTIKIFPVQFESNDINVIFSLLKNAPNLETPELYDMIVKLL